MGKMGEAFIEIGLLDKIDIKKILKSIQPIEDVLKRSTDRRREEIQKAFRHQQKIEADQAAQTKARIAAEIRAEEQLEAVEAERLRVILGENDALDAQIKKAMQLTAIEKQQNQMMGGIRAVPVPGALGGKGGKGGTGSNAGASQAAMNMAQLSYAIQDFSTGLAMGNFTQAVMGASNNLGMMAQSIGPVAGGLTVIAASLLPHAVDAIDKWEGHADRAVMQTNKLKKAFDELQDSIARQSELRKFGFEVSDMESATTAVDKLKDLARQRADLEAVGAEKAEARRQSIRERKGLGVEQGLGFKALDFIAGVGPQQGVTKIMTQEALLEKIRQEKQLQKDIEKIEKDKLDLAEKERKTRERLAELAAKYASDLRSTFRSEMGSPLVADKERLIKELQDRMKDIEKNAPADQKEALSDQARESYRKKLKDAEDEAASRKKSLENKMLDTLDPSKARRRAIDAEFLERSKNIEKEFAGDDKERKRQQGLNRDARDKAIQDDENERARRKAHLGAKLAGGLDTEAGQRKAIEANLQDTIEDINKMGLPDAERQKMIQQAYAGSLKALGDIGPRTSFSGIADLSKQIQTGLTDSPYQKQIADATDQVKQSTQQTKQNLDKIIQDGLKVQGVGLQ